MTKLKITRNLIGELTQYFGPYFSEPSGHWCDFCGTCVDADVGESQLSQTCDHPGCPTIFDVCEKCPATTICHKAHGPGIDNSKLSQEEIWSVIDAMKVHKSWVFMSYHQRMDLIHPRDTDDDTTSDDSEDDKVLFRQNVTEDARSSSFSGEWADKVPLELIDLLKAYKCYQLIIEYKKNITVVKLVGP